MSDEDIKKALECCSKGAYAEVCDKCSLKKDGNIVNLDCLNLEKYALDLVNRQQAEIEKFKNAIKEADQLFSEGSYYYGLAVVARLAIEIERGGENA